VVEDDVGSSWIDKLVVVLFVDDDIRTELAVRTSRLAIRG